MQQTLKEQKAYTDSELEITYNPTSLQKVKTTKNVANVEKMLRDIVYNSVEINGV